MTFPTWSYSRVFFPEGFYYLSAQCFGFKSPNFTVLVQSLGSHSYFSISEHYFAAAPPNGAKTKLATSCWTQRSSEMVTTKLDQMEGKYWILRNTTNEWMWRQWRVRVVFLLPPCGQNIIADLGAIKYSGTRRWTEWMCRWPSSGQVTRGGVEGPVRSDPSPLWPTRALAGVPLSSSQRLLVGP